MDDKPVELLPCPFCGGEAGIRTTSDFTEFWYVCRGCDAESGTGETDLMAAKKWNTRTTDIKSAVEAEREACAQVAEQNWNQKTANMIRARGEKT